MPSIDADGTTMRQRQVLLFAVGCVVLNHPFLSLFSREATVGGVPVLVAALFGVWLLLVVAVGLVVERMPKDLPADSGRPPHRAQGSPEARGGS